MAKVALSKEDELALAQLEVLVNIPGALKLITDEVVPRLRTNAKDRRSLPPLEAFYPDGGDPTLLKRPSSFVLHDVVRLEPNEHKEGQYYGYTLEGDWIVGRPIALLRRLQEWNR